jgi:hypothetical protein
MTTKSKKWPETIDEAVGMLLLAITEESKIGLMRMPEVDLPSLHFGLGTWIHNEFGLRQGNQALLEATGKNDPDDAALVLIEALWRRLRQLAPKVH